MAQLGVTIEYGSKGSDKATKDITKITTSFDKMSNIASSIGVVGNQYAELAKKVYEGAKAFYEFSKAGAKTSEARREFASFEAQLESTKSKLQGIAGEALASSGALSSITGMVDSFSSVLSEGSLAGDAFALVIRGIVEAVLLAYRPLQLAAEGLNYLGEVLELTEPASEVAAEGFDEVIKRLQLITRNANISREALENLEAIEREYAGKFSKEETASLIENIRYNEIQAEQLAKIALMKGSSRKESMDQIKEIMKAEEEQFGNLSKYSKATYEEATRAVQKHYNEVDLEIAKAKGNQKTANAASLDDQEEYFAKYKDIAIAAIGDIQNKIDEQLQYVEMLTQERLRVENLREEIALREQLHQVQIETKEYTLAAEKEIAEINKQNTYDDNKKAAYEKYRAQELQRNSDIADDLASKFDQTFSESRIGKKGAAGVSAFTKNLKEMYKYIDAGNTSATKTAGMFIQGTNDLIGATAEEGWFKAGLQAALETGFGIATAFDNPFASITHFAAAAQFLIAQAFAGKKSGKGSSSGSSGGAGSGAGMGFSGAKTTNDAAKNEVMVIEVDGEAFGRVATKSINKATRYGQAQLSSSTLTKNGKRIL